MRSHLHIGRTQQPEKNEGPQTVEPGGHSQTLPSRTLSTVTSLHAHIRHSPDTQVTNRGVGLIGQKRRGDSDDDEIKRQRDKEVRRVIQNWGDLTEGCRSTHSSRDLDVTHLLRSRTGLILQHVPNFVPPTP